MRTWLPSEVARAPEGVPIHVGGRVTHVDAESFTISDAFVDVVARPAPPGSTPGVLVLVRAKRVGSALVDTAVLRSWSPSTPTSKHAETSRLRVDRVGEALLARGRAYAAIRGWFATEGFVEVETPVVVPSPGLDVHLDALEVATGGEPRWLITSPEYQMKRLVAGGVLRCFQIARCFRRGEKGQRHNPEFSMLEWYRAFAGADDVMADTEAIVRACAAALGAGTVSTGGVRVDLAAPFERLSVVEAFSRHAGIDADETLRLASADEETFFRLLVDRVEPALCAYDHAVFLVRWPAPMASLARLCDDDPRVAERFELYVGGVELCNGFGELTDPAEQRARFERDRQRRAAEGRPMFPIDERFLAALEEGLPPSAGNALGLDRLIALCLGREAIGDVIAFPDDLL